MDRGDFITNLQNRVCSNPDQPILITIKGRYPFITDLRGLDLSNCISVLLLNKFYADKTPDSQLGHFDFVHYLDIGQFWLGGALSRLDILELPQLDESIDYVISALKETDPKFDIGRVRIAVLEEQFVRLAAKIRQRHGIPGQKPQDTDRFTDKACMKRVAVDGGLPTAKYIIATPHELINDKAKMESLDPIGYPIMFKPLHGVGGAGITKIDTPDHLIQWLSSHTDPNMEYLAEEYLDGEEYMSVALVRSNGSVSLIPGPLSIYGHSFHHGITHGLPSCSDILQDPIKCSTIDKFTMETIRVFHPPSGNCVFVQGFLTKEGSMKLTELATRVPGMIGSIIFMENTGISMESVQIMAQVKQVDLEKLGALEAGQTRKICANLVYPKVEGTVKNVVQLPAGIPIKSHVKVIHMVKVGEVTNKATNIGDMAVRVLLWNEDQQQLRKDADWLRENYKPIIME